ncbi:hypothetical protein FRC11_004976 [Ceratobasidium sp. 423]|nr:hypothetical protein FRC11_004976 [Ceratobasidium sp. 423]
MPQPQTQPEPYVLMYVGPERPVDISMEEVEQSSIPAPIKLPNPGKTAKKGKVSAKQLVGGNSDFSDSNDDLHDYGSDTETVTTLYENKCAPNNETIVSVS